MTNTLYCPFCIGKGKYQGMGMIEKKCEHCKGVGYVEVEEALHKVEDEHSKVIPIVVGVDKAITDNDKSVNVMVTLNKDNEIVETVPVELIASKRRGRPPRSKE